MNDHPAHSRPLPHHEHHRRTLLAAIAADSAHEQAAGHPASGPLHRRGWVRPAMAAAAVLIVSAAGIGAHALLRPASQPVARATKATTATASSPAGPRPSAVGDGEWSVTQKYTITAPVSNLIVNDMAGSVSVSGSSGSEVSVTAKIYYRTSRPSISRKVSGRTLSVGYSACADCGVAFTLTVPRAARVTINAQTGRVWVANLAGDVSVSNDTGTVAMDNLTGNVSVQTGTGFISGTGLSAARASFRDQDGRIDVTFTAPPRQLSAVSDTGMVSVQVPSGTTYQVNASSQLGLVDVSVPRSATATHVITATTDTGMVSVSTG